MPILSYSAYSENSALCILHAFDKLGHKKPKKKIEAKTITKTKIAGEKKPTNK